VSDVFRPALDPEFIPDLSQLPRPKRAAPRPDSRRGRRAEAAMVRAEAAVQRVEGRTPLVVVERRGVPHVRLGLAWAGVTLGAVVAGPTVLAIWLALAGATAAAQLCRSWRRAGAHPVAAVAVLTAAGLPLAALSGPGAVGGVLVAGLLLAFSGRLFLASGPTMGRPTGDIAFTLLAAVPAGLAGVGPVLVRSLGLTEALVLFALVWAYDAGAFLVGSGAAAQWEGPAAGAVCTLPVTLVVAAVLVHPFTGASAWVLGGLAAAAAPIGQAAAGLVIADRGVDSPALRRLDSLIVLGPLWAWAAVSLLR
jgi:hypothetical protein